MLLAEKFYESMYNKCSKFKKARNYKRIIVTPLYNNKKQFCGFIKKVLKKIFKVYDSSKNKPSSKKPFYCQSYENKIKDKFQISQSVLFIKYINTKFILNIF